MRLVSKHVERDWSGSITLYPEETEDLWHIYNLIQSGDQIRSTTVRKVVSETATGSTDKTSVRLTLTLKVENVEFDVQGGMLRVLGRNVSENKYVKLGAYHTIDLELNRNFTVIKEEWDMISLERVSTSCDVTKRADIAAVVLQEGLANICLVTENMTIVRQRIDVNIPRKRRGRDSGHEKSLQKFYDAVMQGMMRNINFDIIKVCIIASPGFVKDQLSEYIARAASSAVSSSSPQSQAFKPFIEQKQKFLLLNCSSGHKSALKEILENANVQSRLSDTKYAQEVKVLERFYKVLSEDPNKAFYGRKWVEKCIERGAVESLLVTDELFRSADIPTRRHFISLVKQVKDLGGSVLIFSALHVSGEQLGQLTGVACICKWSCPEVEEEIEEEERKAGLSTS